MTSCANTATAIEHSADAVAQFEYLLGRLTHEESQQATHDELDAMEQKDLLRQVYAAAKIAKEFPLPLNSLLRSFARVKR